MGFDPYSDWLGLPAGRRPPDAYGLLGLARFERDPDRIAAAAEARIRQIGHRAPFDRAAEAKRLLKEVRSAKELLTDPARRRRYELSLRQAEKPIPSAPAADSAPAAATEEVDPRRKRLAGVALGGAALLALFVLGVSWRSLRSETVAAPRTTRHGTVTVAEPAPPAAPEKSSGGDVAASPAESPRLAAPPDPAVAQAAAPAVTHVASRPIAPTTTAPVEAPRPPGSPLAEYRVPSFDSPDERRAFSRHLRGLLDEGFATKGSDLGTAPRHHRAATALTDDTALADYALALVAWNRLRFDEAEAALRSAVAGAPAPFLPARRALIRLHLNHGRRDAALREAVAMADALGRAETDATLQTVADESVRWLGRLTAAIEAPWQPGEPPAEVLQADEEIRRSLGPALSRVYAEGRRSLRDDYAARSEEVDATVARLVAAHAERQTEELQEIAAERGAADAEQEKVGRTADEWKKWLDEQTAEIDPQLEKLVPQFQQLS
ncbi:MAG TPA: hypothetical protein VF170_04760, partial [Planctomycetaceae bacterium]